MYWELRTSTCVLRITGTGYMYDYSEEWPDRPGWYDHAQDIKYIVINEGPTYIGSYAFSGLYNVESVEIGDTVTGISFGAFKGCTSLTELTLSANLLYFNNYAFMDCTSLVSFTMPSKLYQIGADAFNGSLKLHSVTLPQSVTQIGVRAFYGCSNLTYMYVYGQITQINSFAFMNCSSLKAFYCFNARPANVGQYAFRNCPAELCFFYMPEHADTWTVYGATTWNGYPIAQLGGEEWVPADTIVPGEEYLIGFEVNGTTYLMVNYNKFESNAYYCTNAAYWYLGYTAPALKDGTTVTGVYGCAGSLDHCTWIFDAAYGGSIQSGYEADRYLSVSNPNWPDLYPGTINYISWTYNAEQGTLVTTVGSPPELRYASYFSGNENGLTVEHTMCVSSTAPEHRVQLYRRAGQPQPVLIGDVNLDGMVSFTDVSVLYSLLISGAQISAQQLAAGDVNGDGSLSFTDVSALYSLVLGA